MHSDRNKRLSFGTPIVVSQPGRMSVFVLVKFMNTNNKQNNQRHDFGNDLAQIIGVFTALGVVLLFGFKLYGFDYNDLPELFRQLDNKGGNVNELEFVKIINGIVGSDTTSLFKEAGVI